MDLLEPSGDRESGETDGPRDETNPTMTEGECLRRRPLPTGPLGEFRGVEGKLGPDGHEFHGRDRNGFRTYTPLIQ